MRTVAYIGCIVMILLTILLVNLPFTLQPRSLTINQEADSFYQKGLDLFFHDSLNAAKAALQTSIADQPLFAPAHFYLAEIHAKQGDTEKALKEYQTTIDLDRESYLALERLAYLLAELQEYDRAIRALQRAVTLNPYYRQAYELLARLYIQIGDFQSAEAVYRALDRLEDLKE
jgi:tetratricopeptide (TPR) repeat protein